MVTCLLLSAGKSERFGSPKALATLGVETAIERVQKTLLASACEKVIVVLGAHAELIQPSIFIHSRIRVVYNKDHYFGQTSSVQAGWREVENSCSGVMLLPVDCPWVLPSTIDRVIEHFNAHDPDILIPSFHDKKGHPPVFNQRLKDQALQIPSDKGLNSLFEAHPPRTLETDDSGIVKSFNTVEEFEKLKNG